VAAILCSRPTKESGICREVLLTHKTLRCYDNNVPRNSKLALRSCCVTIVEDEIVRNAMVSLQLRETWLMC
jgi:hypothetical protein